MDTLPSTALDRSKSTENLSPSENVDPAREELEDAERVRVGAIAQFEPEYPE
jgi:hypothetical protein